jgi:hypothetical protein
MQGYRNARSESTRVAVGKHSNGKKKPRIIRAFLRAQHRAFLNLLDFLSAGPKKRP